MFMNKEIKWWQVALATVVVSLLGALSTGVTKKSQRKLYKQKLVQAPWAPPSKVFGPAWAINNYFLLKALKQLLERKDISNKNKLLIKQAAIWVIFFSFGYVYFKKEKPGAGCYMDIGRCLACGFKFCKRNENR